MGLLTRLKGDHRRSPSKDTAMPTHNRNNTSSSSLIYSDFSAGGSDSSCTSAEAAAAAAAASLDPRKSTRRRSSGVPSAMATAPPVRELSPDDGYDATPEWRPTPKQRKSYLGIDDPQQNSQQISHSPPKVPKKPEAQNGEYYQQWRSYYASIQDDKPPPGNQHQHAHQQSQQPPPPQNHRRRSSAGISGAVSSIPTASQSRRLSGPISAAVKNRASVRAEKSSSRASGAEQLAPDMDDDAEIRRHISDYNQFLFEDDAGAGAPPSAGAGGDAAPTLPTSTLIPGGDLGPALSRRSSAGSAASYDSIQSGASSKFKVSSKNSSAQSTSSAKPVVPPSSANAGTALRAAAAANVGGSPEKLDAQGTGMSRKSKAMSGMPTPMMAMPPMMNSMSMSGLSQYGRPPMMGAQSVPSMPSYNPYGQPPGLYVNPMMSHSTEYFGSAYDAPGSRRASMTVADSARMRMSRATPLSAAPTGGYMPNRSSRAMAPQMTGGYGYSAAPIIPRIHDGTINRKIEEFVELRHYIACGNKSLEFRLRWVKMLVKAINFNLYSFINIKGEPISPEMVYHNRAVFVKSAVTHLYKLMKEDGGKSRFDVIRADVCYIHGCLLKQDYLTLYNEDYGIDKNVEGAIEMFEKALDTQPSDYRSLYKLGEIFEYEFADEFDKALHYYKEAASLSYNRAILKVAMLYLNVPQIRSRRFIRYLSDLANIDLNDVRVKNDDDKDELDDVIGLACYELGKIYEGIYPGDLSFEDDFIQRCLEVAPVNYAKALAYYNKSAKLNCLYGLVKLGNIYEFGELNRQRNPTKSIQWYMKATSSPLAFKRHPDAMIGLSRWCLNGSGGANKHIPFPNPQMAVMWCDRAIKEFDSADAMYWMGELIEMGVGQGNPNEWYSKAYNLGHEDAARKLGLQPEYNGDGQYEQDDDDEVEFSE